MPTNTKLFYFISFTWGLPLTLVGLFVLLYAKLFMKNEVDYFNVGGRICIKHKEKRFGGVALGIVYMVDANPNVNSQYLLHTHELGHTVQNIIFGPFFLPLIGIPSFIRYSIWGWLKKRHYKKYGTYKDYYGIWFESQASRLGEEYFSREVVELLSLKNINRGNNI